MSDTDRLRGVANRYDPDLLSLGMISSFWSKVDRRGPGCWPWIGKINAQGYGDWRPGKNWPTLRAHRVAYAMRVKVPETGMVMDHLCRNRSCVNPDHLEQVTSLENIRRGLRSALFVPSAACSSGHPRNGNTYKNPSDGKSRCKICRIKHKKKWRSANIEIDRAKDRERSRKKYLAVKKRALAAGMTTNYYRLRGRRLTSRQLTGEI